MPPKDPNDWMWANALEMLARSERMHRQLFQPSGHTPQSAWEPPVDVLEADDEVLIIAALPGVADEAVRVVIEGANLILSGERTAPPQFRVSAIHRMELPFGRFERVVPLPPGRYDKVVRAYDLGCLYITLTKVAS